MAKNKIPSYTGVSLTTEGNARRPDGEVLTFGWSNTSDIATHYVPKHNVPPALDPRTQNTELLGANYIHPSRASKKIKNSRNNNKPDSGPISVSNKRFSITDSTTAAADTTSKTNAKVFSPQNQPCGTHHRLYSTRSVASLVSLFENKTDEDVAPNTNGRVHKGGSGGSDCDPQDVPPETSVSGQSYKKKKTRSLVSKIRKWKDKFSRTFSCNSHKGDKYHNASSDPLEARALDLSSRNTPDDTFGFGTPPRRDRHTTDYYVNEDNTSQKHISPHVSEASMIATYKVPHHSQQEGNLNLDTKKTRNQNLYCITNTPQESPMAKHKEPSQSGVSKSQNVNASRPQDDHFPRRTRDQSPSIKQSHTPRKVPPFNESKPFKAQLPNLDTKWLKDNFHSKVTEPQDGFHRSTSVTSLISFFEQGNNQCSNSRLELAVQPNDEYQLECSVCGNTKHFVYYKPASALHTQAATNKFYEPRQRGSYKGNSETYNGPESARNLASNLPSYRTVNPTQTVALDQTSNSPPESPRAKHERPCGSISLNPAGNAKNLLGVSSMQLTESNHQSLERSPTVSNAARALNEDNPTLPQYQISGTRRQKQLLEGDLKERYEASEHRGRPNSKLIVGDSMMYGTGVCISGEASAASDSAASGATGRTRRYATRDAFSTSNDAGCSLLQKKIDGRRDKDSKVSSVPVQNVLPQQPSESTDEANYMYPPPNRNVQSKFSPTTPTGSFSSIFTGSSSGFEDGSSLQLSMENLGQQNGSSGGYQINHYHYYLHPVSNDNRKTIEVKRPGAVGIDNTMSCYGCGDKKESEETSSSSDEEDDVRNVYM